MLEEKNKKKRMYKRKETSNQYMFLSLGLTPSLAFKELVKHSLKIFRSEPYVLLWILTTFYHGPVRQHQQSNNIFILAEHETTNYIPNLFHFLQEQETTQT